MGNRILAASGQRVAENNSCFARFRANRSLPPANGFQPSAFVSLASLLSFSRIPRLRQRTDRYKLRNAVSRGGRVATCLGVVGRFLSRQLLSLGLLLGKGRSLPYIVILFRSDLRHALRRFRRNSLRNNIDVFLVFSPRI